MINFFIGAWLSVCPIQGQSDTTSVILVEWYYKSDTLLAKDITKYIITDSIKNYRIYKSLRVSSVCEGNNPITYIIGLVTEKLPYKTFLYCKVENYEIDYFYHWGFLLDVNRKLFPNMKLKTRL